jgi:hypothetical protein
MSFLLIELRGEARRVARNGGDRKGGNYEWSGGALSAVN